MHSFAFNFPPILINDSVFFGLAWKSVRLRILLCRILVLRFASNGLRTASLIGIITGDRAGQHRSVPEHVNRSSPDFICLNTNQKTVREKPSFT